ncbi:MAG: NAD(P)H-hydrate epimerase [Elusimicrobia bacterium HGW-Elusimicrobia-4]|nr:MAG: NAD(P)H-hydrate epimerase [Elusimicrobia bacterium HGW-Elusimicrobia-4]
MRKVTVGQIISSDDARGLDKIAVEKFSIPSIVLMENAGKNTAEIILKEFHPRQVAIFCGGGNNGGDGFVIARHLFNNDVKVKVFTAQKISKYEGDVLINLNIIQKIKIPVTCLSAQKIKIPKVDLIVDSLLGTGTKGKIREPYKKIIRKINSAKIPVISVDIPSGIDTDTGEKLGVAVKSNLTVTMVAIKKGLLINDGKKCAGKIIITDIGIIREMLENHF